MKQGTMKSRILMGIQIAACFAIGSAAMAMFAPPVHAATDTCRNIVCTIDIPSLNLSCTYQPNSDCALSGGGNVCTPGTCQPE